jgi:hypothetical protein
VTPRDHRGVADPQRVSDQDRDRVVRDLTRHCGDGRLTLDELEDRIAEAYEATTRLELELALRELPPMSPATQSGPPIRVRPSDAPIRQQDDGARRAGEIALRVHTVVYLGVVGLLVMIWALTSGFSGYFWPMWTAMPWGFALAIHAGIHKAANS